MQNVAQPLHADGIYFDLDEDVYHSDPALGSTDIKRLRTSGPDYWWTSKLNPNRPEPEDKAHQIFGRAVHKLVLEGSAAFIRLYEREPDGDDVLRTADDLARWLTEHGVTKHPRSKAERIGAIYQRIDLLAQGGLIADRPVIFDEVEADAAKAGRILLKGGEYDRIIGAAAAIAENEGLATAFQHGEPEVSVFWTVEFEGVTIRCKARFDYLKIGGVGDLKSIRNSRSIDFVEAVRRQISDFRYDIQAAHYLNARRALPGLVAAGAVVGATDDLLRWIRRVADRDVFGFQWVFYQAEGAPNVKSFTLSPENPIATSFGQPEVERALRTFAQFSTTHAAGQPWRLASPVEELSVDELPAWFARA